MTTSANKPDRAQRKEQHHGWQAVSGDSEEPGAAKEGGGGEPPGAASPGGNPGQDRWGAERREGPHGAAGKPLCYQAGHLEASCGTHARGRERDGLREYLCPAALRQPGGEARGVRPAALPPAAADPPGRAGRRAGEAPLQEGGAAGAAGEQVVLAIAGSLRGVATGRAPFSCPLASPSQARLHSPRVRLNLTAERFNLTAVNLNLTGVRFHSTRVRFNLTAERLSLTAVNLDL